MERFARPVKLAQCASDDDDGDDDDDDDDEDGDDDDGDDDGDDDDDNDEDFAHPTCPHCCLPSFPLSGEISFV